jgi:hypothetical protein
MTAGIMMPVNAVTITNLLGYFIIVNRDSDSDPNRDYCRRYSYNGSRAKSASPSGTGFPGTRLCHGYR